MVGYLVDQSHVQQETWDRLVTQMHFEIWSIDDRHDRLLSRIKARTYMLVYMIT